MRSYNHRFAAVRRPEGSGRFGHGGVGDQRARNLHYFTRRLAVGGNFPQASGGRIKEIYEFAVLVPKRRSPGKVRGSLGNFRRDVELVARFQINDIASAGFGFSGVAIGQASSIRRPGDTRGEIVRIEKSFGNDGAKAQIAEV